jgi:hypothetical protein
MNSLMQRTVTRNVPDAPSRCSTCGVELVGAVRAAPGIEAERWVTLYEGLHAAMRARDWQRVGDCCSPDFHQTSYETGLTYELHGPEEFAAFLASRYDRQTETLFEILFARKRWCLMRFHAFGPGDDEIGPWDVGRVAVAGMGGDGRLLRHDLYDEADIERARARLDEVAGNAP